MLTLAKWTPKHDIGAPLQQLLLQVANGWTLSAEQNNPAYSGMTQMGLAICLAHLANTPKRDQEGCELTSCYTDYVYRLRGLQHQHSTPLFLSQRRHCGQNRHAVQIVDPIIVNTANNAANNLQQGDRWATLQPAKREYDSRHITNQCTKCYQPGTVRREWKVTASQLVILQLQPSSGDKYLPVMRAKGHEQEHTVLHHVRNKTAKLWGKRYALAGALLGIASNREKLAETAFLQYPTKDNPNHYHIYQGTQRSHAITQEDIPSWWVLLALVLREEENEGGPNLQVSKRAKQNKPHRAKRGTQLAKNTSKRRVKKTISKRQSTPRSQHNHASQRRQALQAITQAAAEGHPHHPAPSTSTPSRTNATKASITKQTTLPTPPRTTHMGHTTAPNKTTTPPKTPRYEEPDQQVAEYHAQQPTGNPNPPEHQAGDKRRVPPAPPTDLTSIGRQRGTLGLAGPGASTSTPSIPPSTTCKANSPSTMSSTSWRTQRLCKQNTGRQSSWPSATPAAKNQTLSTPHTGTQMEILLH